MNNILNGASRLPAKKPLSEDIFLYRFFLMPWYSARNFETNIGELFLSFYISSVTDKYLMIILIEVDQNLKIQKMKSIKNQGLNPMLPRKLYFYGRYI
jgi:hypothetical protein